MSVCGLGLGDVVKQRGALGVGVGTSGAFLWEGFLALGSVRFCSSLEGIFSKFQFTFWQ